MSVGYEYLNARARGLMARLLPAPQLKELARSPELPSFLVALATSTPYGPEASALRDVEAALSRRVVGVLRRLWQQADSEPRRWLEPWLARWDLENLKRIVRAVVTRTPLDSVVLAATLSPAEIADLSAAGSVATLANRLERCGGIWSHLARDLRRVSETLRATEERLDLGWATYASERAGEKSTQAEVFARFLAGHVDARNLLTALRLAKDGGGEKAPFLPGGGGLNEERFRMISTRGNLSQALALLEPTPFWDAVREEGAPFEAEMAVGRIERRIMAMVVEENGRFYRTSDPLGVGVLLRYTVLLANEARNLRIIAQGLWRRVPSGLIEERLILA